MINSVTVVDSLGVPLSVAVKVIVFNPSLHCCPKREKLISDIDPVVDVKVVPQAPFTLMVVETVWFTSGGIKEKSRL